MSAGTGVFYELFSYVGCGKFYRRVLSNFVGLFINFGYLLAYRFSRCCTIFLHANVSCFQHEYKLFTTLLVPDTDSFCPLTFLSVLL